MKSLLKQGHVLVEGVRLDLVVPEICKYLNVTIEFFVCLKVVLVHQPSF